MNNATLELMIETKAKLDKLNSDVHNVFKPIFTKDDKFDYNKFEVYSSWRDKTYLTVDEFPGWKFMTAESEEGGGHYSYHVCAFKPGDDPTNTNTRPAFYVEMYWD